MENVINVEYPENDYRNYLEHHGILGMKWGVRRSDTYPLKPSEHSASEKKAGWQKSLNGGSASGKKQMSTRDRIKAAKQARKDRDAKSEAKFKKAYDKYWGTEDESEFSKAGKKYHEESVASRKKYKDEVKQIKAEAKAEKNNTATGKAKADWKERDRKIQEEYDKTEAKIESKYKNGQKMSEKDVAKLAEADKKARDAWAASKEQYKADKSSIKNQRKVEKALYKVNKQKIADAYDKTIDKIESKYKKVQLMSDEDVAKEMAADKKARDAWAKNKARYKAKMKSLR